ncbi:MAG: NADH-quinone oxidoreductase subunit NuoK [Cyclobacteriaceae bacterium]|nr:NADH-quinone oxidoreductase subunit NuoK [Cyclobacteriaceae bacterium]MCX7638397.1 NADH-quinone oxidoreductase subunit NuoK [Cyclobacteriaceae bacterium]MDW8330203.1 NADH-quinone oxidoreductase subunit NuoK [Cyclobacteriaceae bacterium]
MTGIPVEHLLIFSALMFFIGMYGFLTRKNLVTMLIGIELMLNAVNINLVVIDRFVYPKQTDGLFFAMFVIAVAAAEAAVAIAIFINLYRNIRSVDVEKVNEMKY